MKRLLQLLTVGLLSVFSSCENDDAQPSNYLSVKLDGVTHTFIGRSIFEPVSILNDTLENITFLGGYIGSCGEGSEQLLVIEISESLQDQHRLTDGTIRIQLHLENRFFTADANSKNSELSLAINEDKNGRITGSFSGILESKVDLVTLDDGTFSLQRLPDNSNVLEIALELCQ